MSRSIAVDVRPARPILSAVARDRIAAETGTILIHAALLMLLLVPLAAPLPDAEKPENVDVIWLPREPEKPVEPVRAQVTPSRPAMPQPAPSARRPDASPTIDRLPLTEGDGEPVAPDIALDPPPFTGGGSIASRVPAQGVQLQYLDAPPPAYPREAVRHGLTGTVMLEVLVGMDGRPLEVNILRSSGHRVLDTAARRQVEKRWRFRPAMQDGRAVTALGVVPVEFNLFQ